MHNKVTALECPGVQEATLALPPGSVAEDLGSLLVCQPCYGDTGTGYHTILNLKKHNPKVKIASYILVYLESVLHNGVFPDDSR